jgi:hypothetical protein
MNGDGSGPIDWNSQPVGSPGRKINRTALTPIGDWYGQHSPLVLDP